MEQLEQSGRGVSNLATEIVAIEKDVLRSRRLEMEAASGHPGLAREITLVDLMVRLKKAISYRSYFHRLHVEIAKRWGETNEALVRRRVAESRIVAPLLATTRTGGIERSLEELDAADELGRYLQHAVEASSSCSSARQRLVVRRYATLR